jgi:hypothetical protein
MKAEIDERRYALLLTQNGQKCIKTGQFKDRLFSILLINKDIILWNYIGMFILSRKDHRHAS